MSTVHDAAWHDAQYNNRARVPEAMSILSRWAEASAHARAGLSAELDLAYGESPAERLDVFAAPRRGAPMLFFIHGGYWRSLSKSELSFVAPVFVQAGATVVIPNYGLCPAVTIEDIAVQMTRALAWSWRHAARYHADPSRITVIGHSAGGHLAAMLLACRWKQVAEDLPIRLVQSAVSISGLFDLEPVRQAPFLQQDLRLTPASVRRLSPAFFPRPRGPLHAWVGGDESDEFLRQNQLIRDQWGPSTVPVCERVAGKNHFDVLHDLVDPQAALHQQTLALLGMTGGAPIG